MILRRSSNYFRLITIFFTFGILIQSGTSQITYCNPSDPSINWADDTTIWCSCGKVTCTNTNLQCLAGNSDPQVLPSGFLAMQNQYENVAPTCIAYDSSIQTNYVFFQQSLLQCPGTECSSCSTLTPNSTIVGCNSCPSGVATDSILIQRIEYDSLRNAGASTANRCIPACDTQRTTTGIMYTLAGSQSSLCYPCNYTNNCYNCAFSQATGPSQIITSSCLECSYQFARTSPSNGTRNCNPSPASKQSSPFTKIYYLTPSDATRTVSGSPVYTQLNNLLTQITVANATINPYYNKDVTITIYLLKETNSTNILSHYWISSSSLTSYQTDVFKRLNATWTIKPLFINDSNCPAVNQSYCYNPANANEQQATIKFKSNDIVFYVSSQAKVQNIIFDGADLAFYNSSVLNCSQKIDGMCCIEASSGNGTVYANTSIPNVNSTTLACQPNAGDSYTLMRNLLLNGSFTRWSTTNLGLFTMSYLNDYPVSPGGSIAIPSLTLTNCEFRNFWTHQKVSALITLDPQGSNLAINNCVFSNFLFYNGLISNTWSSTLRNYPGVHDPDVFGSLCSKSSCSISITNSQFQYSNYGDYRYYFNYNNVNTFIYNEGIVLFLKDFGGSVSITNNTFQYLASTLRSEQNSFRTEGICEFKVDTPTGKSQADEPDGTLLYTTASTQKINQNSHPWKMYVDKLFYTNTYEMYPNVVNSASMTYNILSMRVRRGSILNLQGISKGLTIQGNTFYKNIGYSGTAFIVDNFTNTATNPIVIYNNNFSNNFGLRMGATFIIVNERRDYRTLVCQGIYVFNNTFTENVGCEDSIGNGLILCVPKLSPFFYSNYYSSRNAINNAFDYFLDYSFSTDQKDATLSFSINLVENLLSTTTYTETKSSVPAGIGLSWDSSMVIIENNTFIRNAAMVSQGIIVSGALKVIVRFNMLHDNFPPLTWLWGSGPYQNSAFKDIYGSLFNSMQSYIGPTQSTFNTGTPMVFPSTPASPVVIRMAVGVSVLSNSFSNNSQAIYAGIANTQTSQDSATYFGSSITMDRILGTQTVNISTNTFQNHYGLNGLFPPSLNIVPGDQSQVKTSFHIAAWNQSYSLGSFISLGFWPLFPSTSYVFGSISSALVNGAQFLVQDNVFTNTRVKMMQESIANNSNLTIPSTFYYIYQTAIVKIARNWEIIFGLTSTATLSSITTWEISASLYPFYGTNYLIWNVTSNTLNNITIEDARPLFLLTKEQIFTASYNTFTDVNISSIQDDDTSQWNAIFRQFYDNDELKKITHGTTISGNTFSNSLLSQNVGSIAIIVPDLSTIYSTNTLPSGYDNGLVFSNNTIMNYYIQLSLLSFSGRSQVNMSNNIISSIVQNFSLSSFPQLYSSVSKNIVIGIITFLNLNWGPASLITNNTLANVTTNFFSGITFSLCSNITFSGTVSNVTFNIPQFDANLTVTRTSMCLTVFSSEGFTVNYFLCNQTNIVLQTQNQAMTQISLSTCMTADSFQRQGNTTNAISDFICSNSYFTLNNVMLTALEQHVPFRALIMENSNPISANNLTVTNVTSSILIALTATTAQFNNCTIVNNTSYNKASGIIISSSSTVSITSTSFAGLTCNNCESIVWIESSLLTATLTSYTNNTCTNGSTLYVLIATVNLEGVTISNNDCSMGSGVLYLIVSTAAIDNSIFSNNSGEVASIEAYTSTITVSNSQINRNSGSGSGSDNFELYDSTFVITNSSHVGRYTGSTAYASGLEGGFVKAVRTIVNMTNSTFSSSAAGMGGFVYYNNNQPQQQIIITNCSFITGYAAYGGAIYVNGLLYIYSSQFLNNNATQGSAIWGTGGNGTLVEITAINNWNSNFYFEAETYLNITNTTLSLANGSSITDAYGIYVLNTMNTNLLNVTVTGMTTNQNGGGLRFEQSPYVNTVILSLTIVSSNFSFNQASNGGAVYISAQVAAEIASTLILNNTATNTTSDTNGAGGGIYYDCRYYACNFTVSNDSQLINNTAGVAGGAMKIVNQPPYNIDTYPPNLTNNTAPYGANIAYYPVGFQQATLAEMKNSPISDILNGLGYTFSSSSRMLSSIQQSGLAIDPPIVLKALDEKGEIVTVDDSTIVEVTTINNSWVIRSATNFVAVGGYVVLYPLNITINPGESFQFNITSSDLSTALASYNRTFPNFSNLLFYTYQTSLCERGQIISDTDVCSTCSSGEYYLEAPIQTSCVACNDSVLATANCAGSYLLLPFPNYWRFDSYQEEILQCLNQEACLGYNLTSHYAGQSVSCKELYNSTVCLTGYCAPGYQGNLCADCTTGYSRGNFITQTCIQCSNSWNYYLINILVFLAAVALILFSTKKALKNYKINIDKKHGNHKTAYNQEVSKAIDIPDKIESTSKKITLSGNIHNLDQSQQILINHSFSMSVSGLADDPSPQKQTDQFNIELEKNSFSNKIDKNPVSGKIDKSPVSGKIDKSLVSKKLDETVVPSYIKDEFSALDVNENLKLEHQRLPPEESKVNDSPKQKRDTDKTNEPNAVEEENKSSHLEPSKYPESTNVYIKIFLTYFQILAIMGEFDFPWGDNIKKIFTYQDTVKSSSSDALNFDCLLNVGPLASLNLRFYFRKLIITAFIPIFGIIVAMIVWNIIFLHWSQIKFYTKCKRYRKQYWVGVASSSVIFLFMIYPTIFQQNLSAFMYKCMSLGISNESTPQSLWYMAQDLEIECFSSDHLKWAGLVAAPSLAVWGVGLPLASFIIVFRYRKELDTPWIEAVFGYLYKGFHEKTWFWEFISILRKVILVNITVFLQLVDIRVQALIALLIGALSYLANIFYQPYINPSCNRIERLAMNVALITVFLGNFIAFESLSSGVSILMFVIIVLINVYFLLVWIYFLLKDEYHHGNLKKIINFCIKKKEKIAERGKSIKKEIPLQTLKITPAETSSKE